jgi:hypothetical protein
MAARAECNTIYTVCMTMLTFRVSAAEAAEVQAWAERLGLDRSELLRRAVRRELVRLESEADAQAWEALPPTAAEQSLGTAADWGPAEDWSDWR